MDPLTVGLCIGLAGGIMIGYVWALKRKAGPSGMQQLIELEAAREKLRDRLCGITDIYYGHD